MYLPDHFHETDPAEIQGLIQAAPLACLVASTRNGLIAEHIPLILASDGTMVGHVARANPVHQELAPGQEVLAIFQGADAYVSPNYYPGKAQHHRHVPTWNYQVVHVHGTVHFLHDQAAKRRAVGLITKVQERRVNGPAGWRMADAPPDYLAQMLDNIVALTLTVGRVLAKSKLSQNRDGVDHAGAVAGLRAAGHHDLADKMEKRRPLAT